MSDGSSEGARNMAHGRSDYNDERFVDQDDIDVDVIVVGAGLTGLTTAYNILRRRAGIDVMVIEAKEDIGGRIPLSTMSEAYHANITQQHITYLLGALQITGSPRMITAGKKKMFYTKSGPVHKMRNYYAMQVHYFLQTIQEFTVDGSFTSYTESFDAENLAKTSVAEITRNLVFSSYARLWVQALMYSICGMRNLDKVSALWLLVMLNGAGGLLNQLRVSVGDKNRYYAEGGMMRILQELSKRILSEHGVIVKSTPVLEIEFNDDRVYVVTARRTYKCDYVVIAVPPPESSHIPIKPPLPEHISKSQTLFTDPVNIFFRGTYRRPFWSTNYTGNVLVAPNAQTNLNLAYDATHSNKKYPPTLAGYSQLPNTKVSNELSLFETLKRCFQDEEAAQVVNFKEFDWTNLNSRRGIRISGSPMSVMMPGPVSNHVNSMETHSDRILLAASEYATNWPGTADGAIEAGEKVASLILLKAKPQALNREDLAFVKRKPKKSRIPFSIVMIQYIGFIMNAVILYTIFKEIQPTFS